MNKSNWKLLIAIVIPVTLVLVLFFWWYQSEDRFELEMKKAYIERGNLQISPNELKFESYGTYDGCTVAFIGDHGGTMAIEYEKVGPYMFKYPDSQKMVAYKDDVFKSLPDAYTDGWLDDEAVKQILEKYKQDKSYLF